MATNNQRPATSSSTFSNYNFDFGIPNRTSSARPLKDLHSNPARSTPTAQPTPSPSRGPAPSWTSGKPSWTHQPSTSAARSVPSNPTSMVGDIFGKSWTSSTPATTSSSSIGMPKSDPNLFGDLLGAALGQGKPSTAPLKDAPPRNAYSTGNLADALPKQVAPPSVRGSAENLQNHGFGIGSSVGAKMGSAAMGRSSTKSSAAAAGTGQGRDPFGNLMDFSAKPRGSGMVNSGGKGSNFGEFQTTAAKGSGMNVGKKGSPPPPPPAAAGGGDNGDFPLGDFQNSSGAKGSGVGGGNVDFSFGAFEGSSYVKSGGVEVPPPANASSTGSVGVDPLDTLFSSSTNAGLNVSGGSQSFGEVDYWDVGDDFSGGDGGGPTTELDGLPPPPAGVTASIAMNKGLDNHKQGQFADAIKWLSWAAVLAEKSGSEGLMADVLTCRASCYKEVGEYKKAIADCTKILDGDGKNVTVLVQRALLYESTEKYKLGAEDLRAVLRIDPTNRLAKTTVHRLTQLAG